MDHNLLSNVQILDPRVRHGLSQHQRRIDVLYRMTFEPPHDGLSFLCTVSSPAGALEGYTSMYAHINTYVLALLCSYMAILLRSDNEMLFSFGMNVEWGCATQCYELVWRKG